MKTKLIPLIVTILAIPASQAATTFSFNALRFNQNGSVVGDGSFTHDFNSIPDGSAAPSITATFTLTSDFDGDSIDDTLTFNLTGTAVTPAGSDLSLNTNGIAGVGNVFIDVGEAVDYTFSIGSLVTSSGGDFEASFDGFTGGAANIQAGESFIANGETFDSAAFDLASSSETLSVSGDVGNIFVAGLDFGVTVEAVPEPSSTALLGLGALGFLVRRRR